MTRPWTDGPEELLQHAAEHLDLGGDFDRRIAMVSIDNAVELTIKTYIGLPQRTRGSKGPSRLELEAAGESFPALLDLLDKHASQQIIGFSLDDIEWYHRLRNQLYHSGNGITVERAKVETYLELAIGLFTSLFGTAPVLKMARVLQTKIGEFLQLWIAFERGLGSQLPSKDDLAYYRKRDYLEMVNPEAVALYDSVSSFRNQAVHGLAKLSPQKIDSKLSELKRLMNITQIEVTQ